MALTSHNIYLANYYYTYRINGEDYCFGEADIFDIYRKKVEILDKMLNYSNRFLFKEGLIAVFVNHNSNNEDVNFFGIYEGREGWNRDDYIKSGKSVGFGFVQNKLITI